MRTEPKAAINHTTLIPAYGRTYASPEAIEADWLAGKDFKLYGCGMYCSIRDIERLAYMSHVTIVDPRSRNQFKVA